MLNHLPSDLENTQGLNLYPGSRINVVAIFSLVLFARLDVWLFECLTLWMIGSLALWMWQSYPKIGVVCPAATHPILSLSFCFLKVRGLSLSRRDQIYYMRTVR